MLTKGIWLDYKRIKTEKCWNSDYYEYDSKDVTITLIETIFATPFSFIIDILISPLELLYYLFHKKIKKDRGEIND